jgi:hypothetical protein
MIAGTDCWDREDYEMCSTCPSGKEWKHPSSCVTCPSGETSTFPTLTCTACAAGKNAVSSELCQDCPAGRYATAGAASCDACPIGTTSIAGGGKTSACTQCPTGTISNTSGSASCVQCAAGTYSSSTSVCSNCPIGTISIAGGACTTCLDGMISTTIGSTSCVPCGAGTTSTNAITCQPCDFGTFQPFQGIGYCVSCPSTHITESVGMTDASSCQECPATTAPMPTNRSHCLCDVGYGYDAGICTTCADGFEQKFVANDVCKLICSLNMEWTTTTTAEQSVCTCIDCAPGTYRPDGVDECMVCPLETVNGVYIDSNCTIGTCVDGYEFNGSDCVACTDGSFCHSGEKFYCPDGYRTFGVGHSSAGMCRCADGFRVAGEGDTCVECSSVTGSNDFSVKFYGPIYGNTNINISAEFEAECSINCIEHYTGDACEVDCHDPHTCTDSQRTIPCESPWQPYCVECDDRVPTTAVRVPRPIIYSIGMTPQVATFENRNRPPLWLSLGTKKDGSKPQITSDSIYTTYDTFEIRSNRGARGSQGWLAVGTGTTLTPFETPPKNAIVCLYVSLLTTAADGIVTSPRVYGDDVAVSEFFSSEWTQIVTPWFTSGLRVSADSFVDEMHVMPGLLSPYPGFGSSWCPAGWYGNVSFQDGVEIGCLPCLTGYACLGDPGIESILPCPSGSSPINASRPLPMSNTCACATTEFKITPVLGGRALECTRCHVNEDCSRGYAYGGITVSPTRNMNQLSCGPLGCCAVDQKGEVFCWGDNSAGYGYGGTYGYHSLTVELATNDFAWLTYDYETPINCNVHVSERYSMYMVFDVLRGAESYTVQGLVWCVDYEYGRYYHVKHWHPFTEFVWIQGDILTIAAYSETVFTDLVTVDLKYPNSTFSVTDVTDDATSFTATGQGTLLTALNVGVHTSYSTGVVVCVNVMRSGGSSFKGIVVMWKTGHAGGHRRPAYQTGSATVDGITGQFQVADVTTPWMVGDTITPLDNTLQSATNYQKLARSLNRDPIGFTTVTTATPSQIAERVLYLKNEIALAKRDSPYQTRQRLGSSWETKPWVFTRDAFPVQGLHTQAIAVSVSQQSENESPNDMSCALLVDGSVKCWGQFHLCTIDDVVCESTHLTRSNTHICDMGVSDMSDDPSCGFKLPTKSAVTLRVSSGMACVATHEGEIWCWGRKLWTHTTSVVGPPERLDTTLFGVGDARPANTLVDFALADRFICAIYGSQLVCAGRNSVTDFTLTGMTLNNNIYNNVYALSAAADSMCIAYDVDASRVDCFGIPTGEARTGPRVASLYVNSEHVTISALDNRPVVLLETGAAATGFACATLLDRSTYCWGDYTLGRRMSAGSLDSHNANEIPSLKQVTAIALGSEHGCAVLANSDVVCWGHGAHGRLGNTTCRDVGSEADDTPVMVRGLKLLSKEMPRTWEHLWGAQATGNSMSTIPEGAAISQTLTDLSASETEWHWVKVYVTVACVMILDDTGCTVLLARNIRNQSPPEADEFFGDYKLSNGESRELSTVAWVFSGDTIAVFVANGVVNVTSVFAFEDSDSCAYQCSVDDYMRNGECIRCRSICAFDEKSSMCFKDTLFPFSNCFKCDTKPVNDSLVMYEFKEGTECHWRCVDEYFLNTTTQMCQAVRTEPCAVGEYLRQYTREEDSTCTRCRPSRQDISRVFVTDGGDESTKCNEECVDGRFLSASDLSCQQCDTNLCGIGEDRFTSRYMTTVPCSRMQPSYCVTCAPTNPDVVITASGADICAYSCTKGLYQEPVCGTWDEHFPEKTVDIMTTTTVNSSAGVYLPDLHDEPTLTFDAGSVFRLTGNIRVAALTVNSTVRAWVHGSSTPLTEFTPRVFVVGDGGESAWQRLSLNWESLVVVSTYEDSSDFYAIRFELIDTFMELSDISLSAQTHTSCSNDPYTCTECSTFSTIPANANFIVSKQCEWTCDESYELREEGCLYCPVLSCIVGEYMSDCGTCSACVKNDENTIFTSNGRRDLDSSCDTRCMDTYFTSSDTGNCTICSPIEPATCSFNSYFVGCTTTSDAHCAVCTVCSTGSYTETACNSDGDTGCAVCAANLSATGYLPEHSQWITPTFDIILESMVYPEPCSWVCNNGYIHDENRGVCKTCLHDCDIGYYETDCTPQTNWAGCMPCVVPQNATVSGRGRLTEHSCPWVCKDGFIKDDGGGNCIPQLITHEAEAVVTQAPCALTSDSCEVGYYVRFNPPSTQESCACLACDILANASTGIAQFTTRGNCEWICINPYIRISDICTTLKDIRKQPRWVEVSSSAGMPINPLVVVSSMIPFTFMFGVACVLVFR